MAESFELRGNPDEILGSATHWTNFGTSAHSAATDVSSVDSSTFIGDEGETYRGRINKDMHPHLTTTGEAWTSIGGALKTYAETLRDLQKQMSALKADAAEQKSKVDAADKTLKDAQAADLANTLATKPDPDYKSTTGDATTGHQNAVNAYNGSVAAADKLREKHRQALDACCGTIDDAKGKRFQKPPGFWDKVKGVASAAWDGFKKGLSFAAKYIAPVLDVIAMVAGVLAFIPILAPIMGPIALVAGGLSLGIKVLNKLANGEGSWLDIGVSALGLIPGVKPLTTLGKASKLAKVADEASDANRALRTAQQGLRSVSKGTRAARRAPGYAAKVANAQSKVTRAAAVQKKAAAAESALKNKYDAIEKAWKWTERGTAVAGAAGNTAVTYRDTGRWDAALVAGGTSLLGYKANPGSKKFTSYQAIVSNGAQTAGQAYNMTVTDKWDDPKSWMKLAASAGKTGISVGNTAAYSSAGTHPNGTSRDAFENANYWR